MMKAKCLEDLFMQNGEKCFTKGRYYTVEHYSDYKITFRGDDQRFPHSVHNVEGGWYNKFKVKTNEK